MPEHRIQWAVLLSLVPENQQVLIRGQRTQALVIASIGMAIVVLGLALAAFWISANPTSPLGVGGVLVAVLGVFVGRGGLTMMDRSYATLKAIAARERPDRFDSDGNFLGRPGDDGAAQYVSQEDLLRAQGPQ